MLDKLLEYLGISDLSVSDFGDKSEVILSNGTQFSKVFGKLDADTDFFENPNDEEMSEDRIVHSFQSDEFSIRLIADLENDEYKVEIEEVFDD